MKKFNVFFILVLFTIFGLAACDKDESSKKSSGIIGEYSGNGFVDNIWGNAIATVSSVNDTIINVHVASVNSDDYYLRFPAFSIMTVYCRKNHDGEYLLGTKNEPYSEDFYVRGLYSSDVLQISYSKSGFDGIKK